MIPLTRGPIDGPVQTAPLGMGRTGDTRERMPAAAENVVRRDGGTHLTLAATAADVGLTNGGVLCHSRCRDDLVGAMVRRPIDRSDGELTAVRGDDRGAGSFSRAYVRTTFAVAEPLDTGRDDRRGAALIAAAAAEPELLVPLQEDFPSMQARVETDGLDPVRATIARLAADGLWLAERYGLEPLHADLRAQVGTATEARCDPVAGEPDTVGGRS
jgi:hypothetical protein